jgi:hypothetical protein
MATLRQFEANRLNAQKSTGPLTPAGKEAPRFNVLNLGISPQATVIPGESPRDLDALGNEYQDQFCPTTPVERYLVDTLVTCDWFRRRLCRAQADLYRVLAVRSDMMNPLGHIWEADATHAGILQKIFRQLTSLERSYHRALTELRRLAQERAQVGPEPEIEPGIEPQRPAQGEIPLPNPPQTGVIGFVPPIPDFADRPLGAMPNLSPRLPSPPVSAALAAFPPATP